jgi:hypothetical protein
MGDTCSTHGSDEKCIQNIVGKLERKLSLWRRRRRQEDNIKMYLRKVRCGSADWINLAQDNDQWPTLVNTLSSFPVP